MPARYSSVTKARLKLAFYLICLVFLGVLMVREHTVFTDSLRVIGHVPQWYVIAGFGALLLSVLASSGVYGFLSPRRLNFWRTALVQGGGLGINRLLPAGSGALGVSYLYLRASKIGNAPAAATVAANNLLGFIGHALLLLIAVAVTPHVFRHFDGLSAGSFNRWLAFAGVAVVGLVVVLVFAQGSKLFQPVRPIISRPGRLVMALSCSMLITICYVTAVLLAAGAIGYHLSLAAGLIVLSFGVAAASAVPVPGGIGAAEAGIFAGLHAYGANTQDALAIALLYRAMTFWLPLIVGGLAFIVVDRRGYLSLASKK